MYNSPNTAFLSILRVCIVYYRTVARNAESVRIDFNLHGSLGHYYGEHRHVGKVISLVVEAFTRCLMEQDGVCGPFYNDKVNMPSARHVIRLLLTLTTFPLKRSTTVDCLDY